MAAAQPLNLTTPKGDPYTLSFSIVEVDHNISNNGTCSQGDLAASGNTVVVVQTAWTNPNKFKISPGSEASAELKFRDNAGTWRDQGNGQTNVPVRDVRDGPGLGMNGLSSDCLPALPASVRQLAGVQLKCNAGSSTGACPDPRTGIDAGDTVTQQYVLLVPPSATESVKGVGLVRNNSPLFDLPVP